MAHARLKPSRYMCQKPDTTGVFVTILLLFVGSGFRSTAAAQQPDLDPRVVNLVASISTDHLTATLKKLESFGTRSTLSSTDSPTRGIGAARQWILDEMKSYSPKLQVSFDTYRVAKQGRITREVELRNVMAILPGKSPRRIYVSGHYDTVARPGGQGEANATAAPSNPATSVPAAPVDPNAPLDNLAPGVNDDGSGTALTIELARVFSQSGINFDATLVFMCHVGEEQGLIGARLHAQKAVAEKIPIEAVLNNDIVGGDHGGNGIVDGATIRVYSEGPEDSSSRELARFIQRWGARYVPSHNVRLMARPDRFGRGGDHSAYNQLGFTAVGFRESRENFTRQHDVRDTFEGLSPAYLAQNARVNAAAAATLALAPPPPNVLNDRNQPLIARAPSGYDANLTWNASPGAVAYRIFWRAAWGPDWEHDLLVGNVTNVVLANMQIDDYVFGIAAVDAEGHESFVTAYVAPARANTPVKTVP
ncbi:MAG TPA: M20/M25/M40 family metallo-hydrolase [Vicinamibacterales bacterium]|nr:M20/M25/M40 family metallo-hydrolase [Vicinamibacterales bacterium]